ncbi:MAG TPA: hypothetical protein VLQ76_01795 [Bacteroidales bacterium]|nr:hypothetical protein [Bacteroidales bacterium]
MKAVSLITLISLIVMSSCNLDPPYVSYGNVPVNITSVSIPESGTVNQPVAVMAVATAPDGCWMNLRFMFSKKEDFKYDLYAVGSYESNGVCPQVEVIEDTLLTFTPAVAGEYVIITLVEPPSTIRRDTVTVTVPGR